MKQINEIKLSFPSNSSNEGFARAAITAFIADMDPTLDVVCDLKTAVSEAVTNCIVHAYPDEIGIIYITAELFDTGKLRVKIRDKGCGIGDIEQAMEPMYTTLSEERAGLGFAVMQSFCDSVTVRSKPGKGTAVTLIKQIYGRGRRGPVILK